MIKINVFLAIRQAIDMLGNYVNGCLGVVIIEPAWLVATVSAVNAINWFLVIASRRRMSAVTLNCSTSVSGLDINQL